MGPALSARARQKSKDASRSQACQEGQQMCSETKGYSSGFRSAGLVLLGHLHVASRPLRCKKKHVQIVMPFHLEVFGWRN